MVLLSRVVDGRSTPKGDQPCIYHPTASRMLRLVVCRVTASKKHRRSYQVMAKTSNPHRIVLISEHPVSSTREERPMGRLRVILLFALPLALMACSRNPAPQIGQTQAHKGQLLVAKLPDGVEGVELA